MVQNYSPKLFSTAAPESPLATESCSPKLCFKATSQRFSLFKAAVQSCSEHLRSLPRKHVPDSDFPKLLSTAIPQTYCIGFQSNCPSMLFLKPQRCSPKLLFKVATESRVPKTLPKTPMLLPEAASKLVWKAAQRCFPTLFPGAAPQSCAPKQFSKAVALKLGFCKPVHENGSQSHFAKRLPKAAPQTCYQKLLSNATAPNLHPFKSIPQNGSPKLFCQAAPENCSRSCY